MKNLKVLFIITVVCFCFANFANAKTHTVKRGECLGLIAEKYSADIMEIAVLNGIEKLDKIDAGQVLQIPEKKQEPEAVKENRAAKSREMIAKNKTIKTDEVPVVVKTVVKTKPVKRTEIKEVHIDENGNIAISLIVGSKDGKEFKIVENRGKKIAVLSITGIDRKVKHVVKGFDDGMIERITIAQHDKKTVWLVFRLRAENNFLNISETQNGIEVALTNSDIQKLITQIEPDKVVKDEEEGQQEEEESQQVVLPVEAIAQIITEEEQEIESQTITFSDDDEGIFEETEKKSEIKQKKKFSWKGFFKSLFSTDIDRNDDGDKYEFESQIHAEIKYKPSDKISIVSSARAEFISREKGDSDTKFELHEAYVDYQVNDKIELSVGKQIVRWGKTDQVSLLDNVNPEDYTRFIIPDLEERKIPIPMIRAKFEKKNLKIEGVVSLPEQSKIDWFGTDWAIFKHLKNDVRQANSLLASFTDQVSVIDKTPENSFKNSEFGIRIASTLFDDMDFELSYFNSFNDIGFVENTPNSIKMVVSGQADLPLSYDDNDIEISYERSHTVGLALETIIGPAGFRSEFGYKSNENFLGRDLNGYKSPLYFVVANVDYTTENNWYINAGISAQHTVDYVSEMMQEQTDVLFFGELSRNWHSTFLKSGITFAVNLDGGSKISPEITWNRIENLKVTLGADIFSGSPETIFGRCDDNDQIRFGIEYRF